MRFLIALCFSLAAAFSAQAAEFEPLQSGPCFARMTGQIAVGDVDRFAAIEQAFERPFKGELFARNSLCLDSPGGSLTEGIKLANYLWNNRIGTRVEGGASCLSACALAFMAGSIGGNEEITGLDRTLDVNGKLGFHRPAISLNTDRSFDAAAMEKSFDLALEATLNFVVMANQSQVLSSDVMVKSDLIEAMFTHRGQDFFYIDTVDKAGRWDIQITGWEEPRNIDKAEAWNACENLGRWPALRNNAQYEPYNPLDVYERITIPRSEEGATVFAVEGSNSGLVEHYCEIALKPAQDGQPPYLVACGTNDIDGVTVAGSYCRRDKPDFLNAVNSIAIFPPTMPISALPTASRQLNNRPVVTAADRKAQGVRTFRSLCSAFSRPLFVANVQNFATMRSGVGFSEAVLAEVGFDTQVNTIDGPFALDNSAQSNACFQSCTRAGRQEASDQDRANLNQCFEQNMIWFRLETATGANGFMSGKFLRF